MDDSNKNIKVPISRTLSLISLTHKFSQSPIIKRRNSSRKLKNSNSNVTSNSQSYSIYIVRKNNIIKKIFGTINKYDIFEPFLEDKKISKRLFKYLFYNNLHCKLMAYCITK